MSKYDYSIKWNLTFQSLSPASPIRMVSIMNVHYLMFFDIHSNPKLL